MWTAVSNNDPTVPLAGHYATRFNDRRNGADQPDAGLTASQRSETPMTTPLDLVPENDDWISVTRRSHGVARVRTHRADKALIVHGSGGGDPRPGDWGEVEADGVFTLRHGSGYAFTATFDGPATSTRLETNIVHGCMGLHAFHRFTDGSGRRDYFTREFFVPTADRERDATAGDGAPFPAGLLAGENDPARILGTWSILDSANMTISSLECTLADGEFTVRAFGPEADKPVDWGTAPAHLYADGANPAEPPSFLVDFELEDRRVHLQGRYYLGVIAGAQYHEFTDGSGRTDFMTRDVFRFSGPLT
jgi:hypothetical protein